MNQLTTKGTTHFVLNNFVRFIVSVNLTVLPSRKRRELDDVASIHQSTSVETDSNLGNSIALLSAVLVAMSVILVLSVAYKLHRRLNELTREDNNLRFS